MSSVILFKRQYHSIIYPVHIPVKKAKRNRKIKTNRNKSKAARIARRRNR